jgi:hypothetical protein
MVTQRVSSNLGREFVLPAGTDESHDAAQVKALNIPGVYLATRIPALLRPAK